jgi:hypothetical protein
MAVDNTEPPGAVPAQGPADMDVDADDLDAMYREDFEEENEEASDYGDYEDPEELDEDEEREYHGLLYAQPGQDPVPIVAKAYSNDDRASEMYQRAKAACGLAPETRLSTLRVPSKRHTRNEHRSKVFWKFFLLDDLDGDWDRWVNQRLFQDYGIMSFGPVAVFPREMRDNIQFMDRG